MSQRRPLEANDSIITLKNLPRPQKIAVLVLFVLALAVIIFWIFQFRSQLTRPLGLDKKSQDEKITVVSGDQNKDTDGDGLADYEELNTYKTSPYLDDTDSDGLMDKQEIDRGSDPLCPEGKNCQATEVATGTNVNINNGLLGDMSGVASTSTLDAAQVADQAALESALSGKIDAAGLRQLLISSGADKTVLDKISDADLMKSYQETLNNQASSSQISQ